MFKVSKKTRQQWTGNERLWISLLINLQQNLPWSCHSSLNFQQAYARHVSKPVQCCSCFIVYIQHTLPSSISFMFCLCSVFVRTHVSMHIDSSNTALRRKVERAEDLKEAEVLFICVCSRQFLAALRLFFLLLFLFLLVFWPDHQSWPFQRCGNFYVISALQLKVNRVFFFYKCKSLRT